MGVCYGLYDRETKEYIDLGKCLCIDDAYQFQMPAERIVKFLADHKYSKSLEIHDDTSERPEETGDSWAKVDDWYEPNPDDSGILRLQD